MTGTAEIIQADARSLPLADDSVDLIVTSPPYFALRSYQDGGEHYAGQLGSEGTPAEFVDALLDVTRECVRVLKPSGSLWVNLGDTYSAYNRNRGAGGALSSRADDGRGRVTERGLPSGAPRAKSLMGIPWRYALRCIDDLGLILRAEVIWSKPNGLPESVTDRVRRSHEQWFHFTLQPRYFSAVDEIREPALYPLDARHLRGGRRSINPDGSDAGGNTSTVNPLGKLPGSVWNIEDDGDSLVRYVLSAVSAGALSIDEGERILWAQRETVSWPTSTHPASAGNGAATECPTATGKPPQSPHPGQSASHIESPTSCSSDPSPKDSISTTSVETEDASTPSTLSQSHNGRTTAGPTPSEQSADTDTRSQTPISTSPLPDSRTRSAEPASSPESSDTATVWVVPTEPLRVPEHLGIDHFAAFPSELPRRIIQGWSPSGVCVECGEGRRPVVHRDYIEQNQRGRAKYGDGNGDGFTAATGWAAMPDRRLEAIVTGYTCACDGDRCRSCKHTTASCLHPRIRCCGACTHGRQAPTTPAVILDPFGGTGTTALVAKALGRHGISVDMSSDYCRLAQWRVNDPDQLAKAARVPKPPKQVDGQLGFDFEEWTA
jgi:DNA modification methylase